MSRYIKTSRQIGLARTVNGAAKKEDTFLRMVLSQPTYRCNFCWMKCTELTTLPSSKEIHCGLCRLWKLKATHRTQVMWHSFSDVLCIRNLQKCHSATHLAANCFRHSSTPFPVYLPVFVFLNP